MSWKVTGLSAAELAAIKDIRLSFKNLEADECVVELAAGFNVPTTTSGTMTVSKSGVTVFRGDIRSVQSYGDGRSQGKSITALGPWQKFQSLVVAYTIRAANFSPNWEAWHQAPQTPFSGYSAASVLLSYFAGLVPGVSVGVVSVPSRVIPPATLEHATVADAIRHVCRYLPRVRVWFDYSTNPPTFRVNDIGSSVANYDVPNENLGKVDVDDINPEITGVILDHYRTISLTDYRTGQRLTLPHFARRDVAGAAGVGGVGTLWQRITDGTPINFYIHQIPTSTTASMLVAQPETYTDKTAFINFWSRYGYSTQGRPQQITAASAPWWSLTPVSDIIGPSIPINQWRILDKTSEIPAEFLASSDNPTGLVVADFKIFQEITVSYGYSSGSTHWTRQPYIRYETDTLRMYRSVSGGIPAGGTVQTRMIPSSLPGLPANVAESVLADNNVRRKDGTAELLFSDIPTASFVGVNRWTSNGVANDPIQQLDVDVFSGRVIARFGQPTHLSPQDFIALQRP